MRPQDSSHGYQPADQAPPGAALQLPAQLAAAWFAKGFTGQVKPRRDRQTGAAGGGHFMERGSIDRAGGSARDLRDVAEMLQLVEAVAGGGMDGRKQEQRGGREARTQGVGIVPHAQVLIRYRHAAAQRGGVHQIPMHFERATGMVGVRPSLFAVTGGVFHGHIVGAKFQGGHADFDGVPGGARDQQIDIDVGAQCGGMIEALGEERPFDQNGRELARSKGGEKAERLMAEEQGHDGEVRKPGIGRLVECLPGGGLFRDRNAEE